MATYLLMCTTCNIVAEDESDLRLFPKDKSKPSGYRSQCRKCRSIVSNKWKTKNAESQGKLRASNHLRRRYGITLDDYDNMLKKQNGKCKICGGKRISKNKTRFSVDHCHTTGKVRGLLCNNCNVGIGKFNDNTDIMMEAIKYILENKD